MFNDACRVCGVTRPINPRRHAGVTKVICSATDSAGNTATASFTVTVTDAAPPVLTVPADLVLEATSPAGAVAEFIARAQDVVDGSIAPVCQSPSGSTFPLGTSQVSCTATGAAGNSGVATFNVTVRDTAAPKIAAVTPSQAQLWAPNHQRVALSVKLTVSDVGDAAPMCSVSGISSNEPVDGTGDGDTGPDWTIAGGLNFSLRAERSGNGSGRIYTVDVRCTDASGNSTAATATVTVPKSQSRR